MRKYATKSFTTVETPRAKRSIFDLSYEKKFTCDMGQLIPVMVDEMVPGDHFKIGQSFVARMQPLVAPILHEINIYLHLFFVPYRLLWNQFEDFISGGVTGDMAPVPPKWDVSGGAARRAVGTLWDYCGMPVDVDPSDSYPSDFPRRAYYLIWNEFYRDQNLQTELDITDYANYEILNRAWEKNDYFSSALLWQTRGTPPAVPIAGSTSAEWANPGSIVYEDTTTSIPDKHAYSPTPARTVNVIQGSPEDHNRVVVPLTDSASTYDGLNDNVVDLSASVGPTIADLRTAFQLTKFLERNARGGTRYTEFLAANYGVFPRDDRLMRPEMFGGSKSRVIISETLQTSESGTTPQGNMAGHGISVNTQFCGSYFAKEFGLVMGIMSIMPRPSYQQGINKQWLRRTKTDYFNSLFAHLSERAIENVEIYADSAAAGTNLQPFGFQGMYSEMRYKPNIVCGKMRDDFSFWHLGRIFSSLPALNETFIKCIPDKRIFAVETEPGFIINYGNLITAIRPIPVLPTPGYLDHF